MKKGREMKEDDGAETPSAAARDAQSGDPFATARAWLAEAEASEINDPNAMSLATVGADGTPNARMVLCKEIEPSGAAGAAHGGRGAFVFYTNYESAKGRELAASPRAAICMHWKSLRRQIRARGAVEKAEPEKADAYFASRSFQSRIGALASAQSRPLESRGALIARAAALAIQHPLGPPRPAHWGGYRLIPDEMEFWSDGAHRLHDRFQWRWEPGAGWRVRRLSP